MKQGQELILEGKEKYPGLTETITNEWNESGLQTGAEDCTTIDELIDFLSNKAVSIVFKSGAEKGLIYNTSNSGYFSFEGGKEGEPVPVKLRTLLNEIDSFRDEFELPTSLSNAGGEFETKILALLKKDKSE